MPSSDKKQTFDLQAIEENKFVLDEHFDLPMVKALNDSFFFLLQDAYFRPLAVGFEEMPERNEHGAPVILAGNHSGMAFPWDAMVFGCTMFKQFNYEPDKLFRPLTAPALSKASFMHPFFMKHAWKRSGGLDATFLNFETMMSHGRGSVLIYPEGVPGIGKGFNRRYQYQRMSTSFVRMSLKYKADIVPYSTINAEYVAPFLYSVKPIDRFFQKLGVPFMPIGPLTIFLLLQPWTFYLSFPVKMTFVRGERLRPFDWVTKPYEDLTEEEIIGVRDEIHRRMQLDLDKAREAYGKSPYRFGEFLKVCWKYKRYFPYNLPIMWCFLFHDFERQWVYEGARERDGKVNLYLGWGAIFRFIWRNPITLAYFVPIFGWFILVWYGKRKWRNTRW